jgi:hypothetical protein
MKTKVGHDETFPNDLLEMIHQSLSIDQNVKNIEIPFYDQLQQANVCVICDRFITGTADYIGLTKVHFFNINKTFYSRIKQWTQFWIWINIQNMEASMGTDIK